MPNEVKIGRNIQFINDANIDDSGNIYGNPSYNKVVLYDDFLSPTLDTTNDWAVAVPGDADSIAVSAAAGGQLLITTGSTDDDSCMLSTELTWYGNKNAICEARVYITDVSKTAIFFGFSSAKSQSTGYMACSYRGGSLVTTNANAAGFVSDADYTTSSIMCIGTKANTDDTVVDSGTDWADGAWHVLRVALVDDEATYYLDGVSVGYCDDAITASTAACVTLQCSTRDGAASQTAYVDYIKAWQDR